MDQTKLPASLISQLELDESRLRLQRLNGFSGAAAFLLESPGSDTKYVLKAMPAEEAAIYAAVSRVVRLRAGQDGAPYAPYIPLVENRAKKTPVWRDEDGKSYVVKEYMTADAKAAPLSPPALGRLCGTLQQALDICYRQKELQNLLQENAAQADWRDKMAWLAAAANRWHDADLSAPRAAARDWVESKLEELRSIATGVVRVQGEITLVDGDVRHQNILLSNGRVYLFDPHFRVGLPPDAYKETALSSGDPVPVSLADLAKQSAGSLGGRDWQAFWDGFGSVYHIAPDRIKSAYFYMAAQTLIYTMLNMVKFDDDLFSDFFALNRKSYDLAVDVFNKPNL